MLVLFGEAYAKDDIPTMRRAAATLYQFNGYTQCIDLYINQHEFFYDITELEKSYVHLLMLARKDCCVLPSNVQSISSQYIDVLVHPLLVQVSWEKTFSVQLCLFARRRAKPSSKCLVTLAPSCSAFSTEYMNKEYVLYFNCSMERQKNKLFAIKLLIILVLTY